VNLLTKVIWEGKSRWQILVAGAGYCVGLFLVLFSLQLYLDIESVLYPDGNESDFYEYLIISKKISSFNTVESYLLGRGNSVLFSKEEIEDLEKQNFIKSLGEFKSSKFITILSSSDFGFKSEIFFESIPEKYLEQVPQNWSWKERDKYIPILISSEYLNLYNFVYAAIHGLPFVSKSVLPLKSVKIDIYNSEDLTKRKNFKAKIVGVSDRIPSILVPEGFIDWANENYGNVTYTSPSRIIIEMDRASKPELEKFLNDQNYMANKERLKLSHFERVFQIVFSVILLVGILFVILSFVIIIVNFQLLVARSNEEIELLIKLGYTPKMLTRNFNIHFIKVISLVTILAFTFFVFVHSIFVSFLSNKGLDADLSLSFVIVVFGIGFFILSFLLNWLSIHISLKKSF